ncbi:MAG: alpha-ketoglutarate-dependent dioxygenase AlkB [Acidimicrobiales bacterium]|nr:alpha-ketoglutarate-dependent dioxygenase AlkB [Acidimicrobiales bacterium]
MATVLAPPLVTQGSLFGGCEPAAGSVAALVRTALDGDAWVDHATGWLAGHDRLFDQLVSTLAWQADRRPMYERVVDVPRLTAWYQLADEHVPAVVADVASLLGAHYATHFDSMGANLYRTGADSVAWHGDRIGAHRQRSTIALLSLGAPRPFLLRPADGGPSLRFQLGRGDLLVMGGRCQVAWQHCVPKVARAEPRLSIALRERVPTDAQPSG